MMQAPVLVLSMPFLNSYDFSHSSPDLRYTDGRTSIWPQGPVIKYHSGQNVSYLYIFVI